jgi:hypothetical protein
MADIDDDELLDALGVEATPLRVASHTPREERIIAGFEDILRFHQPMAAPRCMARATISLNAFMPCALTSYASCLKHLRC